jgi:hypothetical protein
MNMNSNTEPTIDRRDIKTKWGLNKVSDVTNTRKALGHLIGKTLSSTLTMLQNSTFTSSWY